jgi:biopolymer transport protein ExbB
MKPSILSCLFLSLLFVAQPGWCQTDVSDPVGQSVEEPSNMEETQSLLRRASERGQMSVLDLLRTMGPYFIYPFAAFSIWAVYLILANLLVLSETRLAPLRIARQARECLQRGDTVALGRLIERRSDLLSIMLVAGCAKAGREPALIETAMEGSLSQELVNLRNRIRHLADIASIAPMIGLLGTVWGMLKVFQAVALDANNTMIGNWSSLLAEGVAQAMVTTVVGLVIGIPSLLSYYLFRNKLARIIGRLETFGTDLADLFSQLPRSAGNGVTEGRR